MADDKQKLDLRSSQRPQPAPSAADALKGVTNTVGIPMEPGSVVMTNPELMTDYEIEQLKLMGWNEGDPIPANLSDKIAQVVSVAQQEAAEADAKGLSPVDPNTPPVNPEILNIESLPAEKRKELEEFMASAKDISARLEKHPIEMYEHPSVGQAVNIAGGESTLINDLEPQQVMEQEVAAPVPAEEHTHEEEEPSRAGAADPNHRCRRCQFDMNQDEPLLPTPQDKHSFIIATVGQTRFRKVFNLMGGQVQVTFRSLTTAEADLGYQQITYDVDQGRIKGHGPEFVMEYNRVLVEYRMAMGLESVKTPEKTYQVPEVADVAADTKDLTGQAQTKLPQFLDHVYKEFLQQESLRRMVGTRFQWFQSLVDHLEANVDNESFWNGTEAQL